MRFGSGLRGGQDSPHEPPFSHLFLQFTRRVRARLARKREQKPTVRLFATGEMLAKVPLAVLSFGRRTNSHCRSTGFRRRLPMVPRTASTTPRKPGAEATGHATRRPPHELALPVHRLPPEASDGATNSQHNTEEARSGSDWTRSTPDAAPTRTAGPPASAGGFRWCHKQPAQHRGSQERKRLDRHHAGRRRF
jgi:hypothetical protein